MKKFTISLLLCSVLSINGSVLGKKTQLVFAGARDAVYHNQVNVYDVTQEKSSYPDTIRHIRISIFTGFIAPIFETNLSQVYIIKQDSLSQFEQKMLLNRIKEIVHKKEKMDAAHTLISLSKSLI